MCVFKNSTAITGSQSSAYESTASKLVVSAKIPITFAVEDTVQLGITNITTALATLIDCLTINIKEKI